MYNFVSFSIRSQITQLHLKYVYERSKLVFSLYYYYFFNKIINNLDKYKLIAEKINKITTKSKNKKKKN